MSKVIKGLGAAVFIAVNAWIMAPPPVAAAGPVAFEDCSGGDLPCICEIIQRKCAGYFQDNCDTDDDC